MARYRGKHRKPSNTRHTIARFAATLGTVVAAPVAFANQAGAAQENWDALAQCESSGNWAANTGNGFSGGLQFTPSTWAAYGGTQYAGNAAGASREQQIQIARRVLAAQGPGAWPVCSVKTGFGASQASSGDAGDTGSGDRTSGDRGYASPGKSTPSGQAQDQGTSDQPTQAAGGDYTVQSGDTLSSIGNRFQVDWHTIYQRNTTTVHDPNLIFPGQRLTVG